jgi:LDH2 family malate/lactate/ureidoglycolate dehydrogenase
VERQTRESRSAQGVPVDDNTWEEILAGADKLGVNPHIVQRLADGR